MSVVDAAIIKALVEHIGMNPDDVPTDGSSDTIDVSKYQEYPSDSFRIASGGGIIYADKITPKVGDIMYFPNVPEVGEIIAFLTRISDRTLTFIFKQGELGETYEFKDSENNKQYISDDVSTEMGTVKFYTTGIKLNNPIFLDYYFWDIERRLHNVV